MPTLDLEDWEHGLIGRHYTHMKMLAVMLYPDNIAQQEEFLMTFTVRFIAQFEKTDLSDIVKLAKEYLLPEGSFQILLRTPSSEEMSKRDAHAGSRGIVAGDVLLHIVQLEKHGYGGSVNKAVHLLEHIYKQSTTSHGQSVPCNRTSIRNTWAIYKCVAHLWAAERVVADSFFSEKGLSQEPATFLTREFQEYTFSQCYNDLPTFLAMAEAFRQFGIHHVPRSQKVPILPPDETWSCMGTIPLPAIEIPVPPLTELAQDWLAQYRAPIRL
jgi:hypothetical protein